MENLDHQDTDAKEKNNDFSVEYSYASAVFSVQILVEEIELVEAENEKFRVSSETKLNSTFGKFGKSRIRCMDHDKFS